MVCIAPKNPAYEFMSLESLQLEKRSLKFCQKFIRLPDMPPCECPFFLSRFYYPRTFFTTAISRSGLNGFTIQSVVFASLSSFLSARSGCEHDDWNEFISRNCSPPGDQFDSVQIGQETRSVMSMLMAPFLILRSRASFNSFDYAHIQLV